MFQHIVRALKNRGRLHLQDTRPADIQSGAIPYAWVDGEPAYLMVTSRRTGRWIFPKGAIERDMTPSASAAKEAWEEAGVKGEINDAPAGVYRTEKVDGRHHRRILVELFPLKVADQARDWPERRRRRRHWATHRQARRLIDNPELIAVLDRLHADLTAARAPGAADDDIPIRPRKRRRQPRNRFRTR